MSTRCMIFKKKRSWGGTQKTGYLGIYCNWSGYPEYVGYMLKRYYKTDEKIDRLISLGDISTLGREIGQKHDFTEKSRKYVTAYHRDRDDLWSRVKPTFVETVEETKGVCESCKYIYIYENSKWRHIECE